MARRSLTVEKLFTMTEAEINSWIFKGATPYEERGLLSELGEKKAVALLDHPAFEDFSESFKSWIWNAFDCALENA